MPKPTPRTRKSLTNEINIEKLTRDDTNTSTTATITSTGSSVISALVSTQEAIVQSKPDVHTSGDSGPPPPVPKPRSTSIPVAIPVHRLIDPILTSATKTIDDPTKITTDIDTEETMTEEEEAELPQAKFYIGESSQNIIRKSFSEKLFEESEGVLVTQTEQPSTLEQPLSLESHSSTEQHSSIGQLSSIESHTSTESETKSSVTIPEKHHKPSKIPHFDRKQTETAKKVTVEKSEVEKSEKKSKSGTDSPISIKKTDKPMEKPITDLDEAPKLVEPTVHSPITMTQTSFEKPSEIKSSAIDAVKATTVEVVQVTETTSIEKSDALCKKLELQDAQQIDELIVEQTLAEVKESLDAVQEELIGVVKDGKLIKQSPSEFEFKVLPQLKYATDPILESFHEEIVEQPIEPHQIVEEKAEVITNVQKPSFDDVQQKFGEFESPIQSSNEESFNKLDVKRRVHPKGHGPGNRWSAAEVDSSSGESHYQSFERTESRPCSSDIENLMTLGNSSEYQTAHDQSQIPTEYHSALSTFNTHSGGASSRDSMKSLDSESSGNLGSIEVSEASETLVPSAAELELESLEIQSYDLDNDGNNDDDDDKVDDKVTTPESEEISPHMKRSQEMTFQQKSQSVSTGAVSELLEERHQIEEFGESKLEHYATSEELNKLSGSFEDTRFGSMEEGSILSVSLSSASNLETVMENLPDGDNLPSISNSLVGSYEVQSMLMDDNEMMTSTIGECLGDIDNVVITSSYVQDDKIHSVNTQITTTMHSEVISKTEGVDGSVPKRAKGHKRNESMLPSGLVLDGGFGGEAEGKDDEFSLDDEMIIREDKPKPPVVASPVAATAAVLVEEEKNESESDSEYDRYQSEYSRAFKTPTNQKRKNGKARDKQAEIPEKEIPGTDSEPTRSYSPSIIETIVEDVNAETELEREREIRTSQNMLDYSNIPDITITQDLTKQLSSDDDEIRIEVPQSSPVAVKESEFVTKSETATSSTTTVTKTTTEVTVTKEVPAPIQFAQEKEIKMTEEQYEELITKQYKTKMADQLSKKYQMELEDDENIDSAGSDSFELLEQPDISDDFVIIEEVAKEANEFDQEGKSVSITKSKPIKKFDEEVENIVVKSAPAATNEGSMLYATVREQINFEFEDSPPSGPDSGKDSDNGAGDAKKWVELQSQGNVRYPYELERGILEDIKEEDTDFEVGSSRISSFKDSFSSSTPDYDVLAGRKYFTKEHDDISVNSLQEFENLEQAISLENRKFHQGSSDSLSNGSFPKRYTARGAQGDDVSVSSLKEFEGLENACLEAHLIEIKAKEEAALLLSRSDESNRSDKSTKASPPRAAHPSPPTTTVSQVTKTVQQKGDGNGLTTFTTTTTVVSATSSSSEQKAVESIEDIIRSKFEQLEDESSSAMEVSTDSLERDKYVYDRDLSQNVSNDSLDINKSVVDVMTCSLDSIEPTKGSATGVSSISEPDSIEQMNEKERSCSIDSIELQIALMNQARLDRDNVIDDNFVPDAKLSSTRTTSVVTTVTKSHVSGGGGGSEIQSMPKDISSDSLNSGLNLTQLEIDALLTSTDSFDHSSSYATNATYQNESQMSGSMTSCDSNTMIDNLENTTIDLCGSVTYPQFSDFDNDFGMSSSSTTTRTVTTTSIVDGVKKTTESVEIFTDKGDPFIAKGSLKGSKHYF